MNSDRLLNDINIIPRKEVKDEYAEKLLMYKDSIEVEYTANYIPSDFRINVFQDNTGIFFAHYLIELDSLSMNLVENRYVTRVSVNGTISDLKGHIIFQHEKASDLQINQDQFHKVQGQKYSFQDMFPLVEGNFRLSLLLKNEASKEFTSLEEEITIPTSSSLQISDLLLSYKMGDGSLQPGILRHQGCPLGSITFQILDCWAEWKFTAMTQGFQECPLALLSRLFGEEHLHCLSGLDDQIRSPAFDGKKYHTGPLCTSAGETIQHLFAT